MTVTIRRLWTQPYNLQLKSALSWGQGHRLDALNHVLVFAELSDGAVGVAEATPRPSIYGETPESVAAIVAQDCAEMLIGQRIESVRDIHAAQHRLTLQNDLLLGLCLLFACDGVMMPLSEGSMQVAKDTITETALVLS